MILLVSAVLGIDAWAGTAVATLEDAFRNPPDSARPGVYWYFMDGNLDREEMVRDLESMKEAGISNLIFLEVDVGVPRGPVKFMSDEWQDLFANAIHHAERLGIDISLGVGPGWSGSGGPWVKPENAMQHLVYSETHVSGPVALDVILPVPEQRCTQLHRMKSDFYEDVVIYAFPKCDPAIADIDEKALYEREPYALKPGVKPYLPMPAKFAPVDPSSVIDPLKIVDLTARVQRDGRLKWEVPAGEWTILRMGRRPTGASARPAPEPGVGLEHDKFDKAALEDHFANYFGRLLQKVGQRADVHGWTTMHLDSWEMGAQNWTPQFREEFRRRRGYDAALWLVTFSGRVVKSMKKSERFLWDVRLTAQELVLENYTGHLKTLGRQHGFELSIEPYGTNPAGDLDLGASADVPMCEFWSAGMGFDQSFSCIESTSIAHTLGRPVVAAEAFTAGGAERWQQYPWSMKNQGDWAFCMGVNRFVYHTFAHKPLGEDYRPGMTMGPYGVHWDRGQTWWPMVGKYHEYVTRCSHMLRQGVTVSDILYLTPEGAPQMFHPPTGALRGSSPLADKKGYGFDGCSPKILTSRAEVRDGCIAFPGGTSYRLLVLPRTETMTPELLEKLVSLVEAGAVVYGAPPVASPSLAGYPQCDDRVKQLARELWGDSPVAVRQLGKGRIILDTGSPATRELYPDYASTSAVLANMGVAQDFTSDGPIRHGHRWTEHEEIYFVSNTTDGRVDATCTFRVRTGAPQLWDPVTGKIRPLPQFARDGRSTSVPMTFEAYQSFFVVFPRGKPPAKGADEPTVNFSGSGTVATLDGPWEVAFDPKWGGPENVTFEELQDWTTRAERGINYYSGIATYQKTFRYSASRVRNPKPLRLSLGTVHDIAGVRLNGRDLGVVWCAPWEIEVGDALREGDNHLEIDIANRWPNRMLGDTQPSDKDARVLKWDSGLLSGKEYKAGRFTFATTHGIGKLLPSGLLGPVRLVQPTAP